MCSSFGQFLAWTVCPFLCSSCHSYLILKQDFRGEVELSAQVPRAVRTLGESNCGCGMISAIFQIVPPEVGFHSCSMFFFMLRSQWTWKPGVQIEARKGEGSSFSGCNFLRERMGARTAVLNDIVYSVYIICIHGMQYNISRVKQICSAGFTSLYWYIWYILVLNGTIILCQIMSDTMI